MTHFPEIAFVFLLTVENLIFTLCQGQSGGVPDGHRSTGPGHQPLVQQHPLRLEVAYLQMLNGTAMEPFNFHTPHNAVGWTRD